MISLILFFVLISIVVRICLAPFRFGYRRHRPFGFGNYYGYGNPYCYRRHRFGGLGSILALVLLDRLFTGRRF